MRMRLSNQWSADVRRRHAADATAHGGRSDADVPYLRRKDFGRVDVDDGVGEADERFTEHREHDRRSNAIYARQRTQHTNATFYT